MRKPTSARLSSVGKLSKCLLFVFLLLKDLCPQTGPVSPDGSSPLS